LADLMDAQDAVNVLCPAVGMETGCNHPLFSALLGDAGERPEPGRRGSHRERT
jgi:hypothetical protein